MPIYEYKCTLCDERFEVEQSIKDKALATIAGADTSHPKGRHPVKKVFHAPGIAFKGDGFYKNDSRKAKKKSSSSSSESTTSDSTSTKSDTKTDTKSDSTSTTSAATPDAKPAAAAKGD